jgi:hypothetical protein
MRRDDDAQPTHAVPAVLTIPVGFHAGGVVRLSAAPRTPVSMPVLVAGVVVLVMGSYPGGAADPQSADLVGAEG